MKVGRQWGPRFTNEKDAAARVAQLTRASPQSIRQGRRRPILVRVRTLLAVFAGVMPADLEDYVMRYPSIIKLFQGEPSLVVIAAMWKYGPARDALAAAWLSMQSCPSGSSPAAATRDRALLLYRVLVKAVKLLHGVDMAIWVANVGRGVTHHQGWLAWCQLRVPIIRSTTRGALVLGQQRRSHKASYRPR